MSGRLRALVIAHEPLGTSALLGECLTQRGFEVIEHIVTPDVARPNDAAPFPDASEFDLLVPMGSIRSLAETDEIDSWIFAEIDVVRAAHERDMPVLGVCFGGQLLATALGGKVERSPAPEIGWYRVRAADGAGNPVGPGPWFQWHHDRFTPPPDADVLAVNDNAVQLFRVGRSVGTQFHPEVTRQHIKGFLCEAEPDYLAENGLDPEMMLAEAARHQERNRRQCNGLVDWFIDSVARIQP